MRLGERLRARVPELGLVLLGIALRATALRGSRFDGTGGYDFPQHYTYVRWMADHFPGLPSPWHSLETFHPPLFYLVAAFFDRLGADPRGLCAISLVCGSLRLCVIWLGLERFLPGQRLARCATLAIAALLPASVHIDGMASGESMNGLWSALALLVAPAVLMREGAARYRAAALLGVVLSFGLLTKVSPLVIIAALGVTAGAELFWRTDGGARARGQRLASWGLALAVVVLLSGWYFARNQVLVGKPFITSFDTVQARFTASVADKPLYRRRRASFFLGWSREIYRSPFYPSATHPPRFWPLLIASTFADYYNYNFAPWPQPGEPAAVGNQRPLRWTAHALARWSVYGGTVLALAVVLAWLVAMRATLRGRRLGALFHLLVPALALAGLMEFATVYPFEVLGMVKGAYLQFAAPPLYALFGLAVAWCWSRPRARPLAIALGLALAPVAIYTLYCRLV